MFLVASHMHVAYGTFTTCTPLQTHNYNQKCATVVSTDFCKYLGNQAKPKVVCIGESCSKC